MRKAFLAVAIFTLVSSCSHRIYLGDRGICNNAVQGVFDGKPLTLTADIPKDVDPKQKKVGFGAAMSRNWVWDCRENLPCAGVVFHRNGSTVSVEPTSHAERGTKVRVVVLYPATGKVCTVATPGAQSVVLWNETKIVDVRPAGARRHDTPMEQEWTAGCADCTLSVSYRPIFTATSRDPDFLRADWEMEQRRQLEIWSTPASPPGGTQQLH